VGVDPTDCNSAVGRVIQIDVCAIVSQGSIGEGGFVYEEIDAAQGD
jgi:hypothetical protein